MEKERPAMSVQVLSSLCSLCSLWWKPFFSPLAGPGVGVLGVGQDAQDWGGRKRTRPILIILSILFFSALPRPGAGVLKPKNLQQWSEPIV
jgi:hypothetical protein